MERFTAARVQADARAYIYRGADLRRAVEKHLYFDLVNREPVRDAFMAARSGAQYELPTEPLHREILEDMLAAADRSPEETVPDINPEPMRRRLRMLRRKWLGLRAMLNLGRKRRVLAYAANERFVEFLRPVLDDLPADCRGEYLICGDADVREVLQGKELPFVDFSGLEGRVASYEYAVRHGLLEKQSGSSLESFRSLTKLFDHLLEALGGMRADSMTLLLAEGNAPGDEVIARAAEQLGIRTVCLQNGWSPVFHNGFRGNSYSRMLTWGPGFDDWFRAFNPEQDYFAVGNSMAAASGEGKAKCVAFFLQPLSPLIAPEHLEQFVGLIEATAREHGDADILVRDHPTRGLPADLKAVLDAHSNVKFMSAPDFEIAELMRRAACGVTMYSSTIIECIQADVVPLVFNPTSLPKYFPSPGEAGIETGNSDEALRAIGRVLGDDDYARSKRAAMERFRRDNLTPPDDGVKFRIRNALLY